MGQRWGTDPDHGDEVGVPAGSVTVSKRVGERRPVGQWSAEVEMDAGRFRRHARFPITVTDLSVTGVGFTGRLPQKVRRGTTVRLELNGVIAEARIRRVAAVPTAVGSYGAELVRPSTEFLEEIHRLATDGAATDRKAIAP